MPGFRPLLELATRLSLSSIPRLRRNASGWMNDADLWPPRPLEMAPGAREAAKKLELTRLLGGEDFERVVDGIVPLVGGQQEDVVLRLVAIPLNTFPS